MGRRNRRDKGRESGREVEKIVKRREGEGRGNRMEGIWKGREKEKEVEKEEKRREKGICKRRKEIRR